MPFDPVSYVKAVLALLRSGQGGGPSGYRCVDVLVHDDTQLSTTSTTLETVKMARFYVDGGVERVVFLVSYWGDGSNTVYARLVVDGAAHDLPARSSASEAVEALELELGEGLHSVELQLRVSGGTGYTQFFEVRAVRRAEPVEG